MNMVFYHECFEDGDQQKHLLISYPAVPNGCGWCLNSTTQCKAPRPKATLKHRALENRGRLPKTYNEEGNRLQVW